ncbi:HNH endonuclease [Saccharothrix lopnurensis]|uniref:HNH endonuclease n=1 Tax=Saccharothrix lopnurensis TaxID=1670621 RepID=A0ABW1P1M1_9PSEU
MTYFLLGDEWATDPAWSVLAEGSARLIRDLKAGLVDLYSESSHHRHDGYLTQEQVDRWCSRRVVALLTMSVLGRAPKLHRKGDECACLGEEWVPGFTYRIHKFLKRNPSRKEQDREAQKRADHRNTALKHAVWVRDGGCCRYCRSGVLGKKSGRNKDLRKVLNFDHVDPDQPAGPDGENLVTACKRCNTYKGARTPAEADMVLLPAPTEAETAAWTKRGRRAFDLVLHESPISEPINDGSAADQQQQHHHVGDRAVDPAADHQPAHNTPTTDDTTPPVDHQHTDEQREQRRPGPARSPGRVGSPPSGTGTSHPTGQPVRTGDAPDIYHQRARLPHAPPVPRSSTPRPPAAPPSEGRPPS